MGEEKRRKAAGVTIPSFPEPWIDQQLAQYPQSGSPGISYFRGDLPSGLWVDCLVYRDNNGKARAVLNHFPVDTPPWEQRGNILILVAQEWRRRGIGTALLKEALTRWDIPLERQKSTKDGARFVKRYLQRKTVEA